MADETNGEGDAMLAATKTTTVTMATTKKSVEDDAPPTNHEKNMKKFVIACAVLQAIFAVLYLLMARYDVSADARHWKGGELQGVNGGEAVKDAVHADLKLNIDKYPCK